MGFRRSLDFLPSIFRTETNSKFLTATLDQLTSEPELKRLDGYIGRKFSPAYKSSDGYLIEPNKLRQQYQLEPSTVYKDDSGRVKFVSTYQDLLNRIDSLGGITSDQNKLFSSTQYTYNGLFDFDKYVNFASYYWLPNGPDAVNIAQVGIDPVQEFTVSPPSIYQTLAGDFERERFDEVAFDVSLNPIARLREDGFKFSGYDGQINPTLRLARGGTYTFNLDQLGHGFFIQTQVGLTNWQDNLSVRDVYGVENNGESTGSVIFQVPLRDAQDYFLQMGNAGSANLVAHSTKRNKSLRYVELQYSDYNVFLSTHAGLDGQRFIDGKTVVFLEDPALQSTPVDWAAYTAYKADQLIRYGNGVFRATGDFVSGRLFSATNLEIFDADDNWYDPVPFDNDSIPFDSTNFDRGDDVSIETRNGRFKVSIIDGLVVLTPAQLIDVNNKIDILEGVKYGNREIWRSAENELDVVPAITANLDFLYYQDSLDSSIHGTIELVDADAVTQIDVSQSIIGQKTYTSPNNVKFTNGLKVRFAENVEPASFAQQEFYVEGVGSSIQLVPVDQLVTPDTWLDLLQIPYDSELFDISPWDAQSNSPETKDYLVINRASKDRSAWTRNNRWFHQDVITATATYNKFTPNLDFRARANRPIIEFEPNLQLFNFGKVAKNPVDLIDQSTSDALSNVEGLTVEDADGIISSYTVDGVPLVSGMTVIFAADTDIDVRNKVYRVEWIRPQSATDARTAFFTGDSVTTQFDLNFDVTSTLNLEVQIDGQNANNAGYQWALLDNQLLTFTEAPPSAANITASLNYKKQIHLELVDADIQDYQTITVLKGLQNQGNQFYFLNGTWLLGQNKETLNQAPLFDLFDTDGNSLADQSKYPSSNFSGNKVFGYQISTDGTTDSELGFKLKYKNFNNVGDILFSDYVTASTFNYRIGVESVLTSTAGSTLLRNFEDGTVEYVNQWTKNLYPTRQYQTQTYFATVYQRNLFPLNTLPTDLTTPLDSSNLLVYINNRAINGNLYDIQIEGTVGYLLLDTDAAVGDKIDIRIATSAVTSESVFEVPSNLEFNPLNEELADFTLGQMRSHITKVFENTPGIRGSFIGANNSRDLGNIKQYGGAIVQNLGNPTLANLFLNDTTANFVESVQYAQREYARFKSKFLELSYTLPLTDPTNTVKSVDEIIAEIGYNKSHVFPFFASDMIPHGEDYNQLTYIISDTDVRQFDLTMPIDFSTPSKLGILVYHNGTQLVKDLEYRVLDNGLSIELIVADTDVFTASLLELSLGDVISIREYATTDGSYIPPTPAKLGLAQLYKPEIINDGSDVNPRQVIRGHDGSLTALFGDHRDAYLLEYEKRVYNNIKVVRNELYDARDHIPGAFRTTAYTKAQYDQILSNSFNTWLGQSGLKVNDYDSFDSNDPWTWNYTATNNKINGLPMPAANWRGIYNYYFDTDAPHLRPWEMLGFTEEPSWWQYHYGPAPYTRGNQVLWDDLENGRIIAGDRQGIDARFARPELASIIPVDESGIMLSPLDCLVKSYSTSDFTGTYKFGDGGPVETAWRQSSEYAYAQQIALALMTPAAYFGANLNVNTQIKKSFGRDNDQWIYSTTSLRKDSNQKIHGELLDNEIVRTNGYITWVSEYAKSLGLNVTSAVGNKLRNAKVQFSYKMAGYSDKKFLKVYADQATPNSVNSSVAIPDEDFDIVLVKSAPVRNVTYSGVIVTKTPDGFSVNGYDDQKPYFIIETSSTTGRQETIKVGNVSAIKYLAGTKSYLQVPYGTEFISYQQVVDFLISYGRYLTAVGFKFNDKLDEDAGFYKDWDLAAREFLFYVQQGWDTDVAISLSPSGSSIAFESALGVVDGLTDRANGTRVLSEDFKILRNSEYDIFRNGRDFRISVNDNVGIYLLDLDVVNYEHVIVFENITRFNDIIYDPVIGARQYRLKIRGNKTGDWDGSFGAAGFIINEDNIEEWQPGKNYYKGTIVFFKNAYYTAASNIPGDLNFDIQNWIKSDYDSISKGLLPNLANKAGASKKFYDIESVNLELDADKLGKGLIGLRPRQYLTDLQIDDTSQVKFYQGMITEKGSRNSLDKLLRAKLDNFNGEVDFYEDWAIRTGQYGATDIRQQMQLVVDEDLAIRDPSVLELLNANDTPASGRISYKENDIWAKSRKYNKNFLGTRDIKTVKGDLPSAGYVRLDDVNWTALNINRLNDINSTLVRQGDRVAVAVDQSNQWNVYRIDAIQNPLVSLAIAPNGIATFEFRNAHNFAVDDLILIKVAKNTPAISGFYPVKDIASSTKITVQTSFGKLTQASVTGSAFLLVSQRFATPTEIAAREPMSGWDAGDKLFVDSATELGWGVYEKQDAFEPATNFWPLDPQSLTNAPLTQPDAAFGTSVAVDRSKTLMLVGQPGNERVTTYALYDGAFVQDIVIESLNDNSAGFGKKVALSNTGIGAIAAPDSASETGYVFIVKINPQTQKFDLLQIIRPEDDDTNTNFGASIAMSADGQWLAVGQPNKDGGKVHIWQYIDKPVPPPVSTTFIADGSTLIYTLSGIVSNPESITSLDVTVNGLARTPGVDYTLTDNDIEFTEAPFDGSIIVVSVTREEPEQVFLGDGSTTAFVLTGDSATPDNIYNLQVLVDSKFLAPFEDYVLTGSNTVEFTNAPSSGVNIVIRQRSYFNYVPTLLDGETTGDKFGHSLHFSDNGNTLTIGAPGRVVNSLSGAGQVYVYNKTTVETRGDGVSKTFPIAVTTINSTVTVNGEVLVQDKGFGGDYALVESLDPGFYDVVFDIAPALGAAIRMDNNYFVKTGQVTDNVPESNSNLGYSVTMCPREVSVYAGAPYYDGSNDKNDTGHVARYINQARFYGEVTAETPAVTLSSMNPGSFLIINDFWVQVEDGNTPSEIVDAVNNSLIPGVSASLIDGKLKFVSNRDIAEKLTITATFYNVLQQLGLTNIFVYQQTISNPNNEEFGNFGKEVQISLDSLTLAIGSNRSSSIIKTTFDNGSTVFDASFNYTEKQSGAVFTYQYIGVPYVNLNNPGTFIPAQKLFNNKLNTLDEFGSSIAISLDTIYVGAPGDDTYVSNGGAVFSFTTGEYDHAWTLLRQEERKVNTKLINRVSVIDTKNNKIITDLDFIDPYKGKISGAAAAEITYRTSYDPAIYNIDSAGNTLSPVGVVWGEDQVGEVWWNTSATRWMEYEQGDVDFRVANWNTAFPGSAILCYEWTASDVPPTQYSDDANPLSFTPLTSFATHETIDATGAIRVKYYYWVAAKETVPPMKNRSLSVLQIEGLIANPKAAGISYAAFVAPNAVALYNCKQYLRGRDVLLSIDYDIVENEHNIHAEYQLVSEGDVNSKPTADLITKLIDSLSGSDDFGRLVPDVRLPAGLQYGKDFRPRQSMFRNRTQALRVAIEYINSKLIQFPVLLDRDVSRLLGSEPEPLSTEYNERVLNETELGYLNTAILEIGYKVLVVNDSAVSNRWAVYELASTDNNLTRFWKLNRVQSYVNSNYIQQVDWVLPGEILPPVADKVVNFSYNLVELTPYDGMIVKVKDDGRGLYTILRYDEVTAEYVTVAQQNATVQILNNIYDQSITLEGFDLESFDLQLFDTWANIEIQNILRAVYEDIFVAAHEVEKNNWFFMMVQYLLQEQKYVDWLFKTSFIKVEHRQEPIRQIPVYQKDNQDLLTQYINETKPFHTKIREFVLKYDSIDQTDNAVTDFDAPAYYIEESQRYRAPNGTETIDQFILDLDAYRPWRDNHTLEVSSVEVVNGGFDYFEAPTITLAGNGSGAQLVARVANGSIIAVDVIDPGTGFTSTPEIEIDGYGFGAVLVPRMTNTKVRKIAQTIKFDRISTPSSSFLVQFKDANNNPVDIRNEFISRIENDAGVVDILLDILSDQRWLGGSAGSYPVDNVPNFRIYPDASGRVAVEYKRTANGLNEYDLTIALRASSGGVNALDISGTTVNYDDSFVSYTSTVMDWQPQTVFSPGDVLVYDSKTYRVENRFSTLSNFEIDPVATIVPTNTTEYVFNIGAAPQWTALTLFNAGSYFTDPLNIDTLYVVNRQFVSGVNFSSQSLMEITGEDFQSHLDRTWAYYKPTNGQYGKDLSQLFAGVSYPSVNVKGVGFTTSPGYDTNAYDSEPYDQFIVGPEGVDVLDTGSLDQSISSKFEDSELGLRPEDIIVRGGQFVDAYSSHAPEEMIPGQVFDTLDMKVYSTPSGDWADSGISFAVKLTAIDYAVDEQTYNFAVAGQVDALAVYTSLGAKLIENVDFSINRINATITILNTLSSVSTIFVYAYNLGGPSLLFSDSVLTDGSTAIWEFPIERYLVNQLYVTIDGEIVNNYVLDAANTIIEFTVAPAANKVLQVHVFGGETENQQFTHIATELFTVSTTNYPEDYTFELESEVGNRDPFSEKIIVDINGQRLRPSNQAYYVSDGSTTVFAVPTTAYIDPDNISSNDVTVIIDGVKQIFGWSMSVSDGSTMPFVSFATAPAAGSAVTISLATDSQFTVVDPTTVLIDSSVTLNTGDKITITTYTNHDPLNIQTQVFAGLGTVEAEIVVDDFDTDPFASGSTIYNNISVYNLSRAVTKTEYLIVSVDEDGSTVGKYLQPNIDYKLITPTTLFIADHIQLTAASIITVTSFNELAQQPSIGFRIFHSMNGQIDYYRINDDATTILTESLTNTSTIISVADVSKLPVPDVANNIPGVIFIGSERIVYNGISGNTLTNIRRGTAGTSMYNHSAGEKVQAASSELIADAHTKIWYNVGETTASNGAGLQNSTTTQAKFLLAKSAVAPIYGE